MERRLLGLQIALEIKSQHAREPGSVPGGWERWAESILPSRTDWRRLLASEIRRAVFRVSGQVDSHATGGRPGGPSPAPTRCCRRCTGRCPEIAIVCDTSNLMQRRPARAARAVGGRGRADAGRVAHRNACRSSRSTPAIRN